MDTICAVCRLSDGLVINIIVASPSDPAPDGCQLVEIMTGQMCDIGWYWVGGAFHGPRTYAMCDGSNAVVALMSVSYVSPVPPAPDGYAMVEVLDGISCGIGWTWNGATFNPPVG